MEKVEIGNATLYNGDCLEVLPTLELRSVDAVLTDPPYMIGAISIGNAAAKAGTWADMENSAFWFAAWFSECAKRLKETGYLVTFGNWRSIPVLLCAFSKAKISPASCMVWDKEWIGPAGPAQLRPRYEIAILAGMPKAKIHDRTVSDVYACKWMAGKMKTTDHPAEKPVALMEHLAKHTTPSGGLIVDPFMGSGTTGVAANATGRRFIGIERDRAHFETACHRIEEAQSQGALFDFAQSL